MKHCPILDTKSKSFIFLHQTVLTQHNKNLREQGFPGRGEGGDFFLKNLRFPLVFPEILTIFQILSFPWFQACGHPVDLVPLQ